MTAVFKSVCAVALLCAAAPTSAQTIGAADPKGVAGAMQAAGYRAKLTTDGVGDPKIESSAEGVNYSLYFYGCSAGTDCTSLLFQAGFDLPDGTTHDVVNAWNRDRLIGAAWLDHENDPFIEHYVTTVGGLTPDNFAEVLRMWSVAIADFKTHIDF
ncbi:MAG: YbjN domain-containing protein [Rubrimonas sp.]